MNAADYLQNLQALLPSGAAWPRDADAVLTGLLAALAEEFARADARARDLLDEADPRTTLEMLPDWERVAGLPDPCSPADQSVQQRRDALVSRLTSRGGQSIAYFVARAAALGVGITVTEFALHDVESDVDAPLYDMPWRRTWQVNSASLGEITLHTVEDTVDDPLEWWPSNAQLECIFRREKPAQTTVLFNYA